LLIKIHLNQRKSLLVWLSCSYSDNSMFTA